MMASNMGGGDGEPGESLDYRLCFLCQLNSGEALSDISTSQWKANMENQFKLIVKFISKLLRYDALPVDPKTGRTTGVGDGGDGGDASPHSDLRGGCNPPHPPHSEFLVI